MTAPLLTLTVHGVPAPQGSKKGFVHKHSGRVILREQSERLGPWRGEITHRALLAMARDPEGPDGDQRWLLDEPVVVDMVFTFARPQSHYRTGKNRHLLRDAAPPRPSGPPDVSKLARAAEDALSDAGVWRDDARVVEYGRLAKVYVGEDGDALGVPGALIRVWTLAALVGDLNLAEAEAPGTLFDSTAHEGAMS